ncbi:hypothetical protein [Desulfobacula sp.]
MKKRQVVIKCGSETPDSITGKEYPIPECLNRLRQNQSNCIYSTS